MEHSNSLPGGWPLYKGDSNVEPHLIPTPQHANKRASQTTETTAPLNPSTQSRPISTVSVAQEPVGHTLLKVPTARTTQSRPFSITTGHTDNVYVDASESLEDSDEKKKPLTTITSKDGSTTASSADESATTLAAEQPPQPLTTKAIFMKAAFSRYWADWWIWEFLSLLLSLVSMLSVTITCAVYDKLPLTHWPSPMTPHAFIAMFIALAQAGLVMPVYSAIGQLKWLWFASAERPLVDFETFDEASRGHIGGLKLIGTLKGGGIVRHLANFGVLTGILSLAAGPFTQMMISYPVKPVPDYNAIAVVPRAEAFNGYDSQRASPELSMIRAIQNSLYIGSDVSLSTLAPSCSTGNCKFPVYSSLAVCAQVANVTDKLTITPVPLSVGGDVTIINNFNATLPNGAALDAGQYAVNITTTAASGSLAFANMPNLLDTAISNSFIIYRKDINAENGAFGAIEILLNWCVSSFNTTVDATISETHAIANSTTVLTNNGANGALVMRAAEGTVDYTIDAQANAALKTHLASTFSGSYSNGFGYFSTDAAMAISNALYEQTELANVTGQAMEDMQFGGIMNTTQNIAVSMTNNIRQRQTSTPPQIGYAFVPTPYIHVQYAWMCYLGNLVFSSFSLLVVTIWLSRKSQIDVMRNSALAATSALSTECKAFMGPIDRRNKSWLKAYFLKVQLDKRDGAWILESRM